MGKSVLTACAFLAAAAALSACARKTVKIPVSDPTPPYSALNVVGAAERFVLFSGDQPRQLALGPGDSVVLIALGEDRDGGLKDVSLIGNVLAVCGDPARGKGEALKAGSFARRHVLPASRPGRTAPGTQSTRYVLKISEFRKLCGSQELRSVVGAAGVRAVNHHGKSAMSPTLSFRLAAPAAAQAPQASQISRPVFGPLPPWEWPDTPRI
jgi:hypothetical protein